MKQKNSKKRSNIIIAAVGSAAILLTLGIILLLELSPMLTGNAEFKKRYDTVAGGNIETVTLTDFYSTSGTFPEVVEIDIGAAAEVASIRDMFLDAARGAKFVTAQKNPYGSFDISIRFGAGGESAEFYLKENEIYLQLGTKKYSFTPENGEKFSELYAFVCDKLGTK